MIVWLYIIIINLIAFAVYGIDKKKAVKGQWRIPEAIWLDDLRPVPQGYEGAKSVNEAIALIEEAEGRGIEIEVLDLDHDLGDYYSDGGDAIKLLDWLAERETFYPVEIHTANPVGRANMERMLARYWGEGYW